MYPLLGFCALILIVGVLPGGGVSAGFWWDALLGAGYCSLAILAFLGWDSESPATHPRIRLHRNLALLAAGFATIHTLGFLLLDETLIEYLLPSAPAYMLMGMVAFLCLLAATISSLPVVRRKFYRNFGSFRSWHRGLFALVLIASIWHLVGTDFTLRGTWQLASAGLLLGFLPALAYALRRAARPLPLSGIPERTKSVDVQSVITGLLIVLFCFLYALTKYFLVDYQLEKIP